MSQRATIVELTPPEVKTLKQWSQAGMREQRLAEAGLVLKHEDHGHPGWSLPQRSFHDSGEFF